MWVSGRLERLVVGLSHVRILLILILVLVLDILFVVVVVVVVIVIIAVTVTALKVVVLISGSSNSSASTTSTSSCVTCSLISRVPVSNSLRHRDLVAAHGRDDVPGDEPALLPAVAEAEEHLVDGIGEAGLLVDVAAPLRSWSDQQIPKAGVDQLGHQLEPDVVLERPRDGVLGLDPAQVHDLGLVGQHLEPLVLHAFSDAVDAGHHEVLEVVLVGFLLPAGGLHLRLQEAAQGLAGLGVALAVAQDTRGAAAGSVVPAEAFPWEEVDEVLHPLRHGRGGGGGGSGGGSGGDDTCAGDGSWE